MATPKPYVRIALVGAVSVGKSTLLNALLAMRAAPMAIFRTTAGEIIYKEVDDMKSPQHVLDIHYTIQLANSKLLSKKQLQVQDVQQVLINIPPVKCLFDTAHSAGALVAIHDLPGLSDPQTKSAYLDYVRSRFHDYDLVLFVVDVQTGMGSKEEQDILALIAAGVAERKRVLGATTELIVVVNKCDEMASSSAPGGAIAGEVVPANEAHRRMVSQTRAVVDTVGANAKFVCLSAEDAYVHRALRQDPHCKLDDGHLNRFGISEFGKAIWMQKNEEEKSKAAVEYAGRAHCNSSCALTLCGWQQFSEQLTSVMDKAFIQECAVTRVKQQLRQAIAAWTKEYTSVIQPNVVMSALGCLLSKSAAMFAIGKFVSECVLLISSCTVALSSQHSWFRAELWRFMDQFASPDILKGALEITDVDQYRHAEQAKAIYLRLRVTGPLWCDPAVIRATVGYLDAGLIAYHFRIVFNLRSPQDSITSSLQQIKAIAPDQLTVGVQCTKSVPYLICEKLADYAFVRKAEAAERGVMLVRAIVVIFTICDPKYLETVFLMKELIPTILKKPLNHNYARAIAAIESYHIDMAAATDAKQADLVDCIVKCKAHALANVAKSGDDTTVATLAAHAMAAFAREHPAACFRPSGGSPSLTPART